MASGVDACLPCKPKSTRINKKSTLLAGTLASLLRRQLFQMSLVSAITGMMSLFKANRLPRLPKPRLLLQRLSLFNEPDLSSTSKDQPPQAEKTAKAHQAKAAAHKPIADEPYLSSGDSVGISSAGAAQEQVRLALIAVTLCKCAV